MDFLGIKDKVFYIAGVANKKSVAYFSAKTLIDNGARCLFSVQKLEQLDALRKLFPDSPIFVCDVENKQDLLKLSDQIKQYTDKIDGILHSLAFANFSEGVKPFLETKREDYLQAA